MALYCVKLVQAGTIGAVSVIAIHGTVTHIIPVDDRRVTVEIADACLDPGPAGTRVQVDAAAGRFTFFLRDLAAAGPLLVAPYRIAVTQADDLRGYDEIAAAVTAGRQDGIARMEAAPEESYIHAAAQGRHMPLFALLGLGDDARLFQLDVDRKAGYWGWIRPSDAGYPVFPQYPHAPGAASCQYGFVLGRGMGCQAETWRRLEDGVLPILHGGARDGDVEYRLTACVTLEQGLLAETPVQGTPAAFAAGLAAGFDFTPEESAEFERKRTEGNPAELQPDNLTVLRLRVEVVNTAGVPRYGYVVTPALIPPARGHARISERYDSELGALLVTDEERVATLTRLNGRPLPLSELAFLLPAGGTAVLEFLVPHKPVTRERALAMAEMAFDECLRDSITHWRKKLDSAAGLRLPERHLEERVKAGLLQLATVSYGRIDEPILSVPAGLYYPPIGSESLPLLMFYDAMGWHERAARGVQFFLERMREDGFIQVYAHYQIETGAVLFGLAEHFRYTRDTAWVHAILPQLRKICDYLIAWRTRNKRDALRGRGYGMLNGAVADEQDDTCYFFNSGYACAGLRGAAAMVAEIDPAWSRALAGEADAFAADIRENLAAALAISPLVPLSDGTWAPAAPPWAGHPGPLSLYAEPRRSFTHHAFHTQDAVVGPLWLIYQGILAPDEPMAELLLRTTHDLMLARNVAFCQQYYNRHDYAHLRRGEVASFLMDYYHSLSLADPEIYDFWEHYCMNEAGPYKTHEQAWFLMQTRWMLYLEDGDILRLLPGIPRAWLCGTDPIVIDGMVSHFGPIHLRVEPNIAEGRVTAHLTCPAPHRPGTVSLRLPHPAHARPTAVHGGRYDAEHETVIIENFTGEAKVQVEFH